MERRFIGLLITAALSCGCTEADEIADPTAAFDSGADLIAGSSTGGPGEKGELFGIRKSVQGVPPQAAPPPDLNAWLAGAKSGALLLRGATGTGLTPGPALETDVHITVSGLLARAKVSQRFHNPGDTWAEGIYVFPLPDDAAVDHMRIDTGSRVIEGVVQERAEARKTYEQARSQGRRASLLEQARPNVFTTYVANIPPKGEVTVEIEYQQSVQLDQGEFSLRFPMVVGPRYIPGQPLSEGSNAGTGWAADTDRVPDGSRLTPPVRRPEAGPLNRVAIEVDLAPGFAVEDIESPYHDVQIEEFDGNWWVNLKDGPVPADRDFVLQWRPLPGDAPQAVLFTEVLGNRNFALLMVTPPQRPGTAVAPPPREVVFVIDTSGSMSGDSLTQAQVALGLALGRLGAGDRFNVIRFDNEAEALFPQSVDAGPANIQQAIDYVNGLQANGGTNILAAIQKALVGQGVGTGMLRQVVFMTDGSVGNESELFEEIRNHLGASRLFTVGIGSAPNSHFMRKAAEHGRGNFTHIGKPEEVAEKMGSLFRKLEAVVLTDVEIELPAGDLGEQYPVGISDLYLGEPAVFAVALEEPLTWLRVRGLRGSEPWEVTLERSDAAVRRGVHVLWARRKITALMDARLGVQNERALHDLREDVVAVALEHHLVSKYTSLVAVDVTPERRGYEPLASSVMATNLPRNWRFDSAFGMAQGATPAGLQIAVGSLLMAAGMATRRMKVRGRF